MRSWAMAVGDRFFVDGEGMAEERERGDRSREMGRRVLRLLCHARFGRSFRRSVGGADWAVLRHTS